MYRLHYFLLFSRNFGENFGENVEFSDKAGGEDAKFDIAGSEDDKFCNVGEDYLSLNQTFPSVLSQDW